MEQSGRIIKVLQTHSYGYTYILGMPNRGRIMDGISFGKKMPEIRWEFICSATLSSLLKKAKPPCS